MCAGAGSCCCKTNLGVAVPSPPSLPFCLGEEIVQLHLGYCETPVYNGYPLKISQNRR